MSSRSDHGSSAHLSSASYSCPASKAHSMDQDLSAHAMLAKTTTLNVLFLGETNLGGISIVDLICSVEQRMASPRAVHRALGDDVRGVTLDGKRFALYVSPTHGFMSKEGIQNMLDFLRGNGGVHLLVYCMSAECSRERIRETHSTVASNPTLSSPIPAVAVVTVKPEVSRQEDWWSVTNDSLADQGPHFNDCVFIHMATTNSSPTASASRYALHALILQNAKAETNPDVQRAAFYKQRSIGSSFQSLFVTLARKPSAQRSVGSKPVDIVLLGEIGVGKSSLINLIARANIAGVSPDTIGCTSTVSQYTFEEKGRTFRLYDTPGLVDPQMGDKHFFDPIDTIQQLIRGLGNGNGPDLVLFCIDNLKPTTSFKRNYCIFHEFICSSKVPFALAVMKLEGAIGADQWWNKYGASVRRYGIDRSKYIGLERGNGSLDPVSDTEGHPRRFLLSFLATCVDQQKNRAASLRSSVDRVTSFVRSRASTPERALMKHCGLEEQTARELAHRIKNKSVDSYAIRM